MTNKEILLNYIRENNLYNEAQIELMNERKEILLHTKNWWSSKGYRVIEGSNPHKLKLWMKRKDKLFLQEMKLYTMDQVEFIEN